MSIEDLPAELFGKIKAFKNINFSNNQIKKIPNDLFQNANIIEGIYFNNNKINELPENLFPNATSLQEISFSNNQINILPQCLFANASSLKYIDFSNNQIEEIPNNLFQKATELEFLLFPNNKMKKLPENLFANANSLEYIDFSVNEIEEIAINIFQSATKLGSIWFNNNKIKNLPENLFANAESLNGIYFNDNVIEQLPNNLFHKSNELEWISFHKNKLTKLSENLFSNAKSLKYIDFGSNHIEELANDIFKNATKLEYLSFKKNEITNLPENLFSTVESLMYIGFQDNHLEKIPINMFQDAKNLIEIYFNNNKIKNLPENLFANAESLNGIYFNDNVIEQLPNNLFHKSKDLEWICFNNNKITKLSENLFANADILKFINFSFNQIEEIPNDIFQLATELRDIWFNDNKIKKLPEKLFPNAKILEWIFFNDNQIDDLPNDLFSNPEELNELYFGNNKITKLPENLFSSTEKLEGIHFNDNEVKEIPIGIFENAKELKRIYFDNNKIIRLPQNLFYASTHLEDIYFNDNQIEFDLYNSNNIFGNDNLKQIKGELNFSNNNIRQFNFKNLEKFEETFIDFRYNINTSDISMVFKSLFNEKISHGITRIESLKNPKLLNNRLFIFTFNKIAAKIGDDNFKKFENNIKKLEETEKESEGKKTIRFSILDFFISFDKEIIDSFWIILFENYIQNLMKQNVDNIDFKLYSNESLEAIFKRNYLNLIETFFKNEISMNLKGDNQYINKPHGFYFNIDFLKCFKIISVNENEKMAIYLFKILKYIYKRYKDQYSKQDNINRVKNGFSSDWTEYSQKEEPLVKQIFDNNWKNLITSILDDYNDGDDYLDLSNDKIEKSNHILKLIDESQNESFLNHQATNQLLSDKWKKYPRYIYYFHVLLYLSFIITYSFNIEFYNEKEVNNNKRTTVIITTKWYSFYVIVYFILFEYLQLIDSFFIKKELFLYIFSYKNIFELIGFPLFLTTLLLPNSELKSSFYSLTILLSYWILMMRFDKFNYIGKYVNVFGSIITRSIPLFFIVLINLISFVLAFRNRANNNFSMNKNEDNKSLSNYQMTHFNDSFSNSIFKSFELLVGGISTENMGIKELNSYSFINYIIYGCFIFIMTILFINIFTGISIDEIQSLIEHSEAQKRSRKIDYIFKLEALYCSYFKIFNQNKFIIKLFQLIAKPFKKFINFMKKIIIKVKDNLLVKIVNDNLSKLIKFMSKKISYLLSKLFKIFCEPIVNYFQESWKKYNDKVQVKNNNNSNNISKEEIDRINNQINELKMIIQSKFESTDRNFKK
jgi:Leucine-rich repeat (LRR) protein